MTGMAAFPTLAEAITLPVGKLTATQSRRRVWGRRLRVIKPHGEGVRVRAASVDEQLDYEQTHGLGHVTYSLEEFLQSSKSGE